MGLIPAYAGKTPRRLRSDVRSGAHPRVCGENILAVISKPASVGSSPRMRGKLSLEDRSKSNARLIPAYAGKTLWGNLFKDCKEAHPRVCGENQGAVL